MRKIYLLLAIGIFSMANAQVPNAGFEEALSDGVSLKNWGTYFPLAINVDESGNNSGDEIVFQNGNGFSSPVGNCVTGSWAMMLTNAMNVTQNQVIAGKASLFNDADSETATGTNYGYPIAPGAEVNLLGFDYQFFPIDPSEIAEAVLELFGASGQSVGKASIAISGFQSDFAYVYAPVAFTSNETPVFMTIGFKMAKEGSVPQFGSTLFVDNVKVNFSQLGTDPNTRNLFTVFPTAAENEINIQKNSALESDRFEMAITDANGKTLTRKTIEIGDAPTPFDVGDLSAGIYFIRVTSGNASQVMRFLKK